MKRRTVLLEETFKLLATPTQQARVLSIYQTGNKGSANHFMLSVVYDKVVKLLDKKKEVKGFVPFLREEKPAQEPRTMKINHWSQNL